MLPRVHNKTIVHSIVLNVPDMYRAGSISAGLGIVDYGLWIMDCLQRPVVALIVRR